MTKEQIKKRLKFLFKKNKRTINMAFKSFKLMVYDFIKTFCNMEFINHINIVNNMLIINSLIYGNVATIKTQIGGY